MATAIEEMARVGAAWPVVVAIDGLTDAAPSCARVRVRAHVGVVTLCPVLNIGKDAAAGRYAPIDAAGVVVDAGEGWPGLASSVTAGVISGTRVAVVTARPIRRRRVDAVRRARVAAIDRARVFVIAQALVRGAIAVVVCAIAAFLAQWMDAGLGIVAVAPGDRRVGGLSGTEAANVGVVAEAVLVIVPKVHDAVDGALFVGRAVPIIVEAVAGFVAGGLITIRRTALRLPHKTAVAAHTVAAAAAVDRAGLEILVSRANAVTASRRAVQGALVGAAVGGLTDAIPTDLMATVVGAAVGRLATLAVAVPAGLTTILRAVVRPLHAPVPEAPPIAAPGSPAPSTATIHRADHRRFTRRTHAVPAGGAVFRAGSRVLTGRRCARTISTPAGVR